MSQLTATFNTFFQKQHSDANEFLCLHGSEVRGKWSMHFRRGRRRRAKAAAASVSRQDGRDFVSNLSKPFRRYIASAQVLRVGEAARTVLASSSSTQPGRGLMSGRGVRHVS